MFEAHSHATIDPNSKKLRNDLERVMKMRINAGNTYTKAVDASYEMIGTGSGRVMVLLPFRATDSAASS